MSKGVKGTIGKVAARGADRGKGLLKIGREVGRQGVDLTRETGRQAAEKLQATIEIRRGRQANKTLSAVDRGDRLLALASTDAEDLASEEPTQPAYDDDVSGRLKDGTLQTPSELQQLFDEHTQRRRRAARKSGTEQVRKMSPRTKNTPELTQDEITGTPAEGMDEDARYKAIEQEFRQKWLQEHPGQDFLTEAGQNYRLGYMSPQEHHLPTLRSDTEKAFREQFPEDAQEYDKNEQTRIYKNLDKDPAYQAIRKAALEKANNAIEERRKRETLSHTQEMGMQEAYYLHEYDDFVMTYPEKAQAYADNDPAIQAALDRQEKRRVSGGSGDSEQKPPNDLQRQFDEALPEVPGLMPTPAESSQEAAVGRLLEDFIPTLEANDPEGAKLAREMLNTPQIRALIDAHDANPTPENWQAVMDGVAKHVANQIEPTPIDPTPAPLGEQTALSAADVAEIADDIVTEFVAAPPAPPSGDQPPAGAGEDGEDGDDSDAPPTDISTSDGRTRMERWIRKRVGGHFEKRGEGYMKAGIVALITLIAMLGVWKALRKVSS